MVNRSDIPLPSIRLLGFSSSALFLASLVFSAADSGSRGGEYLSLAFHLAAFFMVPQLQAPQWARAAGYAWLALDVTAGIMSINGIDQAIAHSVRLGGHVFAAIWITTASSTRNLAIRAIGIVAGLSLLGYSLIAPFIPQYFLAPAAVSVLAWFALVGQENKSAGSQP